MKLWFFFFLLFPCMGFAQVKPLAFIIEINDRSIHVLSPEKKNNMFSVIVENKSLSDQVGKFVVGNKIIKFISVKTGRTESIEIENKTSSTVVFIPVSPASQEVPLNFGKKAYEIPSKE